MELHEFLEVASLNCEVWVYYESTFELLAIYDGRNSIPEYFNDAEVCRIKAHGSSFLVYIK